MTNYWTQTLSPELVTIAAQQRRVPYVMAGATMVALASLGGYPMAAGAISLAALVFTGRTCPDLWSLSSIASPGTAGLQGLGTQLASGPPPIAHMIGLT